MFSDVWSCLDALEVVTEIVKKIYIYKVFDLALEIELDQWMLYIIGYYCSRREGNYA